MACDWDVYQLCMIREQLLQPEHINILTFDYCIQVKGVEDICEESLSLFTLLEPKIGRHCH